MRAALPRVPASNCGIWGFRPSHDFVSVAGVTPLTTRTIFSKFARVSRTGRSAVYPNNTRARSSQGRSTRTQFEWERLLSSHIIADERCRDGPHAASVAPNSDAGRVPVGLS